MPGAGAPAVAPLRRGRRAGKIRLRVRDVAGRPLRWRDLRRIQTAGTGEDAADDVLLDARTLRVLDTGPLKPGTGKDAGTVLLDRPAGDIALALSWPASAGYSTLIIDLPDPGTYEFADLAARQLLHDLETALTARPAYRPGPAVTEARARALTELAARSPGSAARALDAAAGAWVRLLTEYGGERARARRDLTWGFTLDDAELAGTAVPAALAAVGGHGPDGAVRVVFDRGTGPAEYRPVVDRIHRAGMTVVGQFLDSSDLAAVSLPRWRDRVREYVRVLPDVDTWEVGNEVNGDWTGTGTVEKIDFATRYVTAHTRARTMLTLYWDLGQTDPAHSTFTWLADRLPAPLLALVDDVGLSLYPEQCPMGVAFDRVMRTLHAALPAQRVWIGELGYWSADLDRRWWWGPRDDPEGAGRAAVAAFYGTAVAGYDFAARRDVLVVLRDRGPRGRPAVAGDQGHAPPVTGGHRGRALALAVQSVPDSMAALSRDVSSTAPSAAGTTRSAIGSARPGSSSPTYCA